MSCGTVFTEQHFLQHGRLLQTAPSTSRAELALLVLYIGKPRPAAAAAAEAAATSALLKNTSPLAAAAAVGSTATLRLLLVDCATLTLVRHACSVVHELSGEALAAAAAPTAAQPSFTLSPVLDATGSDYCCLLVNNSVYMYSLETGQQVQCASGVLQCASAVSNCAAEMVKASHCGNWLFVGGERGSLGAYRVRNPSQMNTVSHFNTSVLCTICLYAV
jgi:hypothetical protein